MNTSKSKFTKTKAQLFVFGVLSVILFTNANAAEGLSTGEMGHLSYQNEGQTENKIAIATTVISRINEQGTQVAVSQVFENQDNGMIAAEYHFPTPDRALITGFSLSNSFQSNTEYELPQKTVLLEQGDLVTVNYQYSLSPSTALQASIMGFPTTQKPTLDDEENIDSEALVASK